jgi:tetratricopeptide (TPR) repeat protein
MSANDPTLRPTVTNAAQQPTQVGTGAPASANANATTVPPTVAPGSAGAVVTQPAPQTSNSGPVATVVGGASPATGGLGGSFTTSLPSQDLSGDKLVMSAPRIVVQGKPAPSLGGIPLLAKLGQGGMGAVYYGVHPRLEMEVAIKVLPFNVAESNPDSIQRFYREAKIAAKVKSPHLVSVSDVNEENGLFYLVMEFVKGTSAGSYLKGIRENGQAGLNEAIALDICIAATEGLAAAHQQGIIHRDVKPDNIMIPTLANGSHQFKNAKLADLGLARSNDSGKSLTGADACMGTPGYMSPEQSMDARHCGKPADVFSMGATVYALLTGRAPFGGSALMKILLDTQRHPHTPVRELRPDVSAATAKLIDRCLMKDSSQRFEDADALLVEMRRCRDAIGEPDVTLRPVAAQAATVQPAKVEARPAAKPALKPVPAPAPQRPATPPVSARQMPAASAKSGSAVRMVVSLLVLLAILGGGGWVAYEKWQEVIALKEGPRPAASGGQKPGSDAPEAALREWVAHNAVSGDENARRDARRELARSLVKSARQVLPKSGRPDPVAAQRAALQLDEASQLFSDDDKQERSACLIDLGYCLRMDNNPKGDWGRARTAYDTANKLKTELNDNRGRTLALLGLAWCSHPQHNPGGNWDDALALYQAAQKPAEDSGDAELLGESLEGQGWCRRPDNNSKGSWSLALDTYAKAEKVFAARNDLARQASCVENQAFCWKPSNNRSSGDWSKAALQYERALKLVQQTQNPAREGDIWQSLGICYSPDKNPLGDWNRAIDAFTNACKLRGDGKKGDLAGSYIDLANCWCKNRNPDGDWDKALKCFDDAQRIAMEGEDFFRVGCALLGKAWCARPDNNDRGQWTKSADYYRASAEAFSKAGRPENQAEALHGQAWCFRSEKNTAADLERASLLYKQAAQVYQSCNNFANAGRALMDQGFCMRPDANAKGNWNSAAACFESAAAQFGSSQEKNEQARALMNQAICLVQNDKKNMNQAARTLFERSVALFRESGNDGLAKSAEGWMR